MQIFFCFLSKIAQNEQKRSLHKERPFPFAFRLFADFTDIQGELIVHNNEHYNYTLKKYLDSILHYNQNAHKELHMDSYLLIYAVDLSGILF